MAHVISSKGDTAVKPLMDRLTHSVIKETSKNLKYYIDVKRRENAFVLNAKPPTWDTISFKKLTHGNMKECSMPYGSVYGDKDSRGLLPSCQPKQKTNDSIWISPEKQMCREELNFHMRAYNFSPRDNTKPTDLRLLKANIRSSSSCGASAARESRPRSTLKSGKHEQEQLIDDTANILASMVKSRRSIHGSQYITPQAPPTCLSQTLNSSTCHVDDDSSVQRSITNPTINLRTLSSKQESKKEKRLAYDPMSRTSFIMQKTKLIANGFLCSYKISIITGNCNGASTNAPIRIKLHGRYGHSGFHELVRSETHHVPFLKDQTDLFTLQTYHVGDLVGITIGHDHKDMRASWFLSQVSIDDPIRKKTYTIPCNAWLSIKSIDQKTMREFQVASTVLQKKKISVDEIHEDNESQSDYSTGTIEGTLTSNRTNTAEKNSLLDAKEHRKYGKPQHVSIGPITIGKRHSNGSTDGNSIAPLQSTLAATLEAHFKENPLLLPPAPVPIRLIHSPALSATSSDTEIEGNITGRTRSTTRTPSPTFRQVRLQTVSENDTLKTKPTNSSLKRHSIGDDRPPARLERRLSPSCTSSEKVACEDKEETNKTHLLAFF